MSSMDSIRRLQEEVKSKFNRLINLERENRCYDEFIRNKKLDDEYEVWRGQFYQQRKWKNKNDKTNKPEVDNSK